MIEARANEMEATLLLEGRDWDAAARLPAVGGQEFRVEGVHDRLRGALPPDVRRARGAERGGGDRRGRVRAGARARPRRDPVGGRGAPDPGPPRGDVPRPAARRRRRAQPRRRHALARSLARVLHLGPDARGARGVVQQGPRRRDRQRSRRSSTSGTRPRTTASGASPPSTWRRGSPRRAAASRTWDAWRRRSRRPATRPPSTTSSS